MRKHTIVRPLTPAGIRDITDDVVLFMHAGRCDENDEIRVSVSLENNLMKLAEKLGEASECRVVLTRFIGITTVTASVRGVNASTLPVEEDHYDALMSRMLNDSCVESEISYENGANRVKYEVRRPNRLSMSQKSLLGILAGLLVGGAALLFLPAALRAELNDRIVLRLFSTYISVLASIAGAMVFLTVTQSIYAIGSRSAFKKVGGRFFRNTLSKMFLYSAICVLVCSFLFKSGENVGTSSGFYQVFDILLAIIPTNLVDPFLSGNVLQILFMGVVLGLAMLMLGDRVPAVRNFIDQLCDIVNHIMQAVMKLLPISIALSIISLMVGSDLSALVQMVKALAVYCVLILLVTVVPPLIAALRWKLPVAGFYKATLPALLTSFTTASSVAALPLCMDICENKIGIDEKLVKFGMPMSIALYKVGGVVDWAAMMFGLAEIFGIAITPVWAVTCAILIACMCIAVPAVPGAGLTVLTLLITQLGIPAEALALAMAYEIIVDYSTTACGVYCGIAEMTNIAGSLKMLHPKDL